jgi:exodeoxyribonuclease VII large subunit
MTRGITVSQLNNYIKSVFEAEEMLHNIEVIGEISGFKMMGGVAYFSLRDEGAAIPCTCYQNYGAGGTKVFRDGIKVLARGTVSYWHKAGKISFVVNKCEEYGAGDLMALFEKLKEQLKREGLFDPSKKKQIPETVTRVGVVTSKSGAVIHDIKTVAARRNPNVDIVLYPVHVQGQGADIEIANAIEFFGTKSGGFVDVVIVARGGGSAEDLSAFNSERVARAVFQSKIPIISAVGHEVDFTLIDLVADLRAATPSVAAELCVRSVTAERDKILQLWAVLKSIAARKIDRSMQTEQWTKIKSTAQQKFAQIENKLNVYAERIEAKNPIAVLKRGFAKTNFDLGKIKTGDEFEIMYYNNCKIEKGAAEWKRKI